MWNTNNRNFDLLHYGRLTFSRSDVPHSRKLFMGASSSELRTRVFTGHGFAIAPFPFLARKSLRYFRDDTSALNSPSREVLYSRGHLKCR